MSSDEKVLDFPRVEGTSEENARRVMTEATRLARLAPGEWRLWIDRSATRFRQEHPPWCSTFSGAETVCQRRTDRSQRIPYG
jgi:hypothetical protein